MLSMRQTFSRDTIMSVSLSTLPQRNYPLDQLTNTYPRSLRYPERKNIAPRRLSYIESQVMSEKRIVNEKQLKTYLENCADYERKVKLMAREEIKALTVSPLAPPMTPAQTNPISMLQKYRYQICCRPSHDTTSDDDSPEIRCTENVWSKLKVSEKMLSVWCERLRKWICQTIIMKLVCEIEEINRSLCAMGSPELQIGAVNIFTLRQIAVTKADVLPTLSSLLPYLDMALNQEYLIYRLKDLARGGCMRDYKWNSGGIYRDNDWSHDLPTDCAIVMHVFSSYMNFLLPTDPHSADGKAFSYKYFKKTPEKPVFSTGSHYIYQSKINPPHYAVVIDDEVYGLSKGHNNLFCAILLLLHYTKTKEYSMLGRVNLGPSGLNLSWILEW